MVDERYAVAHFLDRRHIMSGKQDCGSVVVKLEYLLFELLGIHWVETGEGLVENHKRRTVYNRADELYFLSHTSTERASIFLLAHSTRFITAQPPASILASRGHPLQPTEIHDMIDDLHLFI